MVGLAVMCAAQGCGGPPPVQDLGDAQSRVLTEPQALLVVEGTLNQAGAQMARAWQVSLGGAAPLEVDARVGDPPFGIEWVTDADRAVHGSALPRSQPGGALRIVSARDEAQRVVQILVLDPSLYGYEANPRLVQRGAPGIDEAEERLRRDLRDFLEYVRGQGGQL